MGRPRKPLQKQSNGVYCVQLYLDGKRVMRSLETRDIEVAHRRAAQAMAELEAEHVAKKQGATRWREPEVFSNLLDESDYIQDPQLAAEQFTGKRAVDEETGEFFDKDGEPLDPEVLRKVHAGTKVNLIVDQKPYAMGGNVGTSLKVLGVQILEIKTHDSAQGDRDPYAFGDDHLSQDDLGALFKAAS